MVLLCRVNHLGGIINPGQVVETTLRKLAAQATASTTVVQYGCPDPNLPHEAVMVKRM